MGKNIGSEREPVALKRGKFVDCEKLVELGNFERNLFEQHERQKLPEACVSPFQKDLPEVGERRRRTVSLKDVRSQRTLGRKREREDGGEGGKEKRRGELEKKGGNDAG